MLERRFGRFVPSFLLRRLMRVETEIEAAVGSFSDSLPSGARVLDAGAGEGRYARHFHGKRYIGVDLAIGDGDWNYSDLDALADLAALPVPDGAFDAVLNIVTLEHTPEPARVLCELARALKPGGRLLLVAPQQWEVHQAPHDYYRYTRHGLTYLLQDAGLHVEEMQPLGGYFTLLARRLVGSLNFFQSGVRWVFFPFVVLAVGPAALLLPALDRLDSKKDFTLAYICVARKP